MKPIHKRLKKLYLLLAAAMIPFALSACSSHPAVVEPAVQEADGASDTAFFLAAIEDEPDTVDFQCTSIHYTVAQNVFNRLVEMENDADGGIAILPSLAESWAVSDDGRDYSFHLREGVTFSNGAPLTSSDVRFTLTRLLTHPDACNQAIAEAIVGAERLEKGETDQLEGFRILNDLDFIITLEEPFEAFLACLSMPGASILDEETTSAADDRFGTDPACTVGTGSFILREWVPGKGMLLEANPDCWAGAPACAGLDLRFVTESEAVRSMFEEGRIDILDLDELGNSAEFFIHGDIYQERLHQVQQIGITYIALNESIPPLNDVRVRRALQISLNRALLMDAVYSGRGWVENGIFPHGLYGFNPELAEIPYDPDEAVELLAQAGYPDGFDLSFAVKASSTQWEMSLVTMAVDMWEKIGVRASVEVMDEDEFMRLRKGGELACYTATWIADYNDPDNFIYTFYGDRENTTYRSLCYSNEEIMARVRKARMIADSDARLREYRELERIIVQEDAAWIPLFSRQRYYVTSERVEGFVVSWNGSVKNNYRHMSVIQPQ